MACEIITKDIPLTQRELDEATASANNTRLDKVPPLLFEAFLRIAIKSMRKATFKIKLPTVTLENEIVKSLHTVDAGKSDVDVFFYKRAALIESGAKKMPLLYFIHGGGFIGGTHFSCDNFLKSLVDKYDVVCAAIDYHLAPEVRYPYALNECVKGVLSLIENEETGVYIDENSVFIAGDSAGGNLAAAATLCLKKEHSFAPKGQVLFYPVTEMLNISTPSYNRSGSENSRMLKFIKICRKLYASKKTNYAEPYFSPLLSKKSDDPNPTPALILQAERDGLLDDGVLYAKHIDELGGESRCIIYNGAFHAFLNGLGDSDIAQDALEEVVSFMGV